MPSRQSTPCVSEGRGSGLHAGGLPEAGEATGDLAVGAAAIGDIQGSDGALKARSGPPSLASAVGGGSPPGGHHAVQHGAKLVPQAVRNGGGEEAHGQPRALAAAMPSCSSTRRHSLILAAQMGQVQREAHACSPK